MLHCSDAMQRPWIVTLRCILDIILISSSILKFLGIILPSASCVLIGSNFVKQVSAWSVFEGAELYLHFLQYYLEVESLIIIINFSHF